MSKSLFIAEKPSVAKEFAKVLNVGGNASKGYLESDDYGCNMVRRAPCHNELSGSI